MRVDIQIYIYIHVNSLHYIDNGNNISCNILPRYLIKGKKKKITVIKKLKRNNINQE